MTDIKDPQIWKEAIKLVRDSGYICQACGKPLLNFSSKIQDDHDLLIKGHCETFKHPAQFYVVDYRSLIKQSSLKQNPSTQAPLSQMLI